MRLILISAILAELVNMSVQQGLLSRTKCYFLYIQLKMANLKYNFGLAIIVVSTE